MKKKLTNMGQFQAYYKEHFNLTVTPLDKEFAIIEERRHLVHLCPKYFKNNKCDAAFIRGEDKCKCGIEIPGKFKMLDKIYAMETV